MRSSPRPNEPDRELGEQLLGDVVFVEGWELGWQIVERFQDVRAVTPEGDVISATGMRVAQADGVGYAALEAATVAHEVAETERRTERGSESVAHVAWHFVEEGRAAGPVQGAEFVSAVREGRIQRNTMVWCAGMKEWQPADEIAGLADLLGPPPVPSAPAS